MLAATVVVVCFGGNACRAGAQLGPAGPYRTEWYGTGGGWGDVAAQIAFNIPANDFEKISTIKVSIGEREFSVTPAQLVEQHWTISPQRTPGGSVMHLVAPASVRAESSWFPWQADIKNWPGDGVVFRPAFFALGLLAMLFVVRYSTSRRDETWVQRGLTAANVITEKELVPRAESWCRLAAGAAVPAAALVMIEIFQPFYFTQDDVFSARVARHDLYGPQSLFRRHSRLGSLSVAGRSLGQPGWPNSIPPTCLAYFIARYLLGNEYLTAEVFAVLHLVVGYLLVYWLSRKVGMRPALAAAAGLSLTLSGFLLIVGDCGARPRRSWSGCRW